MWTPLHFAAYFGHTATAELILQHQGSVNPLDISNRTPLHWAALEGHIGTAKLLREWGGSIE